MPRTDRNQVIDANGNVVSEVIVQTPMPVVDREQLQQAKQTIRNMVDQFWDEETGQPTGTPTAVQLRNWLLAVSVGLRYVYRELDNE